MPFPVDFNLPSIQQKEVLFIGYSATIYDSLLMFGDEIKYVWNGRKSLVFYLYILNRALLIAYQFWNFYYNIILTPEVVEFVSSDGNYVFLGPLSNNYILAEIYVQTLLTAFFLLTSDIFVTLRMRAISKSKIIIPYFMTLALARLLALLIGTFLPFNEYDSDVVILNVKLNTTLVSVGTAFEVSAFIVIVWYIYRNRRLLKFSGLVRAIVTQATVYFLAIVGIRIYLQVALSTGIREDLFGSSTSSIYCFFNPVLTLRFAVELKKSADPEGREKWQSKHFSDIEFVSGPPDDAQDSTAYESIEMGPVDTSHGRERTVGPRCSVSESGSRDV